APAPVPQLGSPTGTGLGQAVPTTPPPTTAAPTTTAEDADDRGDERGDGRGGRGGLEDLVPGWPFPGRGD
ncbi:hypothetical protein, partial [Klenkia sp. PcliD-1-E]|uniref:hypothetical protein n=1 Tax=Klenkia sp. PcliD-1-E TaxID=2954492 RepID=UPI002097AFAE